MHDQLADGKRFKTLSVLDEFTRECLARHVGQSIRVREVTRLLAHVMVQRGAPVFVRSDNGSEFTAMAIMAWLRDQQVGRAFIPPGQPWQNGYTESFHSRFRDGCLNREWFQSGAEAAQVIEAWRQQYNIERPHSSLGYRPPRSPPKRLPTEDTLRASHSDWHQFWRQVTMRESGSLWPDVAEKTSGLFSCACELQQLRRRGNDAPRTYGRPPGFNFCRLHSDGNLV